MASGQPVRQASAQHPSEMLCLDKIELASEDVIITFWNANGLPICTTGNGDAELVARKKMGWVCRQVKKGIVAIMDTGWNAKQLAGWQCKLPNVEVLATLKPDQRATKEEGERRGGDPVEGWLGGRRQDRPVLQ